MWKRLIVFLVSGLSVGVGLSAQTYEEWCERASAAIEQDSLPQAEAYIRRALEQDPANPHNALLFSNLGIVQRALHKYEDALNSYDLALNMAPRNVSILLNRAALCLELGKNGQALADYSLVIDLQPENREALLMRAYIYGQQRDYRLARADYDSLLKHVPQDFEGRLGLAMLNQKEKKYEAALSLLTDMVEEKVAGTSLLTASRHAVVYVARAGVEKDMGHLERALMDLNEAIRLDASRAEAYLVRGQIYLSEKEKKLALRDFEKAASLGIPVAELEGLIRQCR